MKDKKPVELTLTAAWDRDTKAKTKETYDGGFHITPAKKPKKRAINKRTSLQEFTFH